ncbi:MAG: DUF485 domain-containing protein [Zavarzinella sp.]
MAGPTRGNLPPAESISEKTVLRNRRVGLWLFALYLLFYGAYVVISAWKPQWMAGDAFSGLNWAVVSGMALIFGAFLIALIYSFICRNPSGGKS